MKRLLHIIACIALSFTGVTCLYAQEQKGTMVSLEGHVTTVESGKMIPVEGAVVQLKPSSLFAMTDRDGHYFFPSRLDVGEYTINVQILGFVPVEETERITKGNNVKDFVLKESSLRLEEVTVVAENNKAGDATASRISRQAIDHSQTSSLMDLMLLLPGASASNPDLSSAKSLNLRTAGTSSMNSLGTAVIMDGSPMSNNANMEAFGAAITGTATTAAGTSTTSVGSVPNSGIDVRSISTDNIESIEVIRGIPSVQYGDLTSGAVIINSKAGVEPLTIRFKTDPKIAQGSASTGFKLDGGKAGTMHISGDYAYSNSKTTETYAFYQRAAMKAMYSKTVRKLSTTTSLDLRLGKDTRNPNPDDTRSMLSTGGTNVGYRFSTNGTWTINHGWLKTMVYNVSNSFTYKESFKEQMCSNATAIYSSNMVSGSTVSNTPGKHYFDIDGNEITSFTSDNNGFASFTPDSYFSHYDFFSKELNTYAKITANLFKAWGDASNRIIAGADFKSDGNLGDGIIFKDGLPPQHSANGESGYRARPLYDIPFVNQTGIYAEDSFKASVLHRELNLTAGVRYDLVGSLTALSPRMNISYELAPRTFAVRCGWGITAKAPTSAYLYPDNAYYDQSHYNGGVGNNLALATTYVIPTVNRNLEMAKNRKAEIGFDLKIFDRFNLSVTAYDELMRNGYTYGQDATCFVLTPYKYYRNAGTDSKGNTILELTRNTRKFFQYYMPVNNAWEHNRGIEYELDLGRFNAIRTSFFINGAWMLTENSSSGRTYKLNLKSGSTVDSNVSIWEPFKSTSHFEKFMTSLRATHNIPSIGFVVTLTTLVNVYTKNWNTYMNKDDIPQQYISRADGLIYAFSSEMAEDNQYSYMFDKVTGGRYIVSSTIPTVVFNLNVSKEINKAITASFYVNNVFNSRPLDPSEVSAGSYTELNKPMYFGFELKIKI